MVEVRRYAPCLTLLVLTLAACDDEPPKSEKSSPSAAATAPPAPTTSASASAPAGASGTPSSKPTSMPALTVDAEGPYLGGARIDLAAAGGKEKLARIVKDLPIDGKAVTLTADKKAKAAAVSAVIEELGRAGAPKILIKTSGRGDLPKEVTFTPAGRVSTPPGCSVASMVLKDLSTAIWPIKGGVGKRQRKGFAGPDLTHTGESLKKELGGCDSTMAFVGSEEAVPWEDTFNLAGTVLANDEKKHIDTLVLLPESPVAGRPVVLAK